MTAIQSTATGLERSSIQTYSTQLLSAFKWEMELGSYSSLSCESQELREESYAGEQNPLTNRVALLPPVSGRGNIISPMCVSAPPQWHLFTTA